MVLRIFGIFLLSSLVFACGSKSENTEVSEPLVDETKPITSEEAKNVYLMNCASCHGNDGRLQASNAKDLSISTLKATEIEQIIQKGSDKGMMPFGEILTKPQIEGLVDYVQTLRK